MFRNIFSKIFKKKKTKRSFKSIGKEEYNFDFQVEKDIYQNLCCNRVKKKVIEMLEQKNLKFYTYSEWKQYIYNKYKNCNRAQLLEFIRYLNQGIRNVKPFREVWDLFVTVIMTLVFVEGGKALIEKLESLKSNDDIIIEYLTVLIFIVITIFWVIRQVVMPILDNDIEKHLYKDYKEIIDEMIKEKKG